MCIIATIPQKIQIQKSTLKRCWDNNPHGGGFMFTDGKKVQTFKEMTSFKRYWREFLAKREEFPNSTFVCHFRISTHGKINETNCHPFNVNDKLGFVHNGIIRNAPISADYSDTYMFNVSILQTLPTNFTDNLAIMVLLKEYIGSGSKLCFLSADNNVSFVNESAGVWDEGVWYSNGGYKESSYHDAGGVRVTSYASSWGGNNVYHGKAYSKQTSMGFASAVIPNVSKSVTKKTKGNFTSWYDNLKTEKIDSEVITIAKSSYADNYAIKCAYCDKEVKSYTEKQNHTCFHCEDRYATEWSF